MAPPRGSGLIVKTFRRIRRKRKGYLTSVSLGRDVIPLPTFTAGQWLVVILGAGAATGALKLGMPWQASLFLFSGFVVLAASLEMLSVPRRGLWVRFEGQVRLRLFWWVQFATTRPQPRGKL